jgi:hypothetical protein
MPQAIMSVIKLATILSLQTSLPLESVCGIDIPAFCTLKARGISGPPGALPQWLPQTTVSLGLEPSAQEHWTQPLEESELLQFDYVVAFELMP